MTRISDMIKKDHHLIKDYFDRIVNSQDPEDKTRYQNQFTWELARHAIGEELVVYPAMEKHLRDDGHATAEKDRQQHQIVKEQLKTFQDMSASDPQFMPTIQHLMGDLLKHMEEEERVDLVKLDNAITAEESEKLCDSFHRTKMFVPTRSHPSAPNKPPFETVVGLLTAPYDQLMDAFRRFPNEVRNPPLPR